MKDKIFGVLQRVGRSFMLPIAVLPIAGILLGLGSSLTNQTTIETYGLTAILGDGTFLNSLFIVMNKVAQAVNIPGGIAKISVYKKKAQPNGYFKIGTEFGPCYISAAKLNEDLEVDALTEDLNKELQEKFEAFKRYDDIFMKFN